MIFFGSRVSFGCVYISYSFIVSSTVFMCLDSLTALTFNKRNMSISLKEHLKLRWEKARSLVQLKKSVVLIFKISNVGVLDYIVNDKINSITSILHSY